MNQMHVNQEASEALSAGVDGELSPHELRFLLRRMDHDAELQRTWSRYHVIREGLRGRLPALASSGFAKRMQDAIALETLPARLRRRQWLRWSAGGAIAASVAAATLMIGQPQSSNDTEHVIAAQSASRDISTPATTNEYASRTATMPSIVPPWLSGGAAGALSQPASVTLGAPFTEISTRPGAQPAAYAPPLFRQRTLDNRNGTYLLLLDPTHNAVTRDAAVAQ